MSMILWGVVVWLALQLPAAILLGRFIGTGSPEKLERKTALVLNISRWRRVKPAGVSARTAVVAGYRSVGAGR